MIEKIQNIPKIHMVRESENKFLFFGMMPSQYTKFREIIAEYGCEIICHTAHRTNLNEIVDIVEIL